MKYELHKDENSNYKKVALDFGSEAILKNYTIKDVEKMRVRLNL